MVPEDSDEDSKDSAEFHIDYENLDFLCRIYIACIKFDNKLSFRCQKRIKTIP